MRRLFLRPAHGARPGSGRRAFRAAAPEGLPVSENHLTEAAPPGTAERPQRPSLPIVHPGSAAGSGRPLADKPAARRSVCRRREPSPPLHPKRGLPRRMRHWRKWPRSPLCTHMLREAVPVPASARRSAKRQRSAVRKMRYENIGHRCPSPLPSEKTARSAPRLCLLPSRTAPPSDRPASPARRFLQKATPACQISAFSAEQATAEQTPSAPTPRLSRAQKTPCCFLRRFLFAKRSPLPEPVSRKDDALRAYSA